MPVRGCIACSGDVCDRCMYWEPTVQRWGICHYFTDNPTAVRRLYAGNVKGLLEGETVETTSNAKCRNFERRS